MSDVLRINEIKNFLYCPRISYYTLSLQIDRETDLSVAGIRDEAITKQRMKRRRKALHSVIQGKRHFDVHLEHLELGLVGRIDELIETPEGVYLIDYKDTNHDYGYWKVQMLAYQLCAESMGYHVLGCSIYVIPQRRYQSVQFTSNHYKQLLAIRSDLHTIVRNERIPDPVAQLGKCRNCQYSRLCNDVF